MNVISSRDALERLFRGWWLITAAIILGGLIGWGFSLFHKPIYEAHAEIIIRVDSALWEQERKADGLQEIELFISTEPISDILFSDEVVQELVTEAQAEGIPLDRPTVLTTFSIQRVILVWQLTVRGADAATAARLADLWVQAALPIYQAAHEHAASASALELERLAVVRCFTDADFASGNACAGNSFTAPADLETALAGLDARIITERDSARGVDAALTLEAGATAAVPSAPMWYARSWLALAGALTGLIVGIAAAEGLIPLRKKKHDRAS